MCGTIAYEELKLLEQDKAIRDELRSLSRCLTRWSDLAKKALIEDDPETMREDFWPWFIFVEVAGVRLLV